MPSAQLHANVDEMLTSPCHPNAVPTGQVVYLGADHQSSSSALNAVSDSMVQDAQPSKQRSRLSSH